MLPAYYRIDWHAPDDLVSATLAGFFNVGDVVAYAAEAESAINACFRRHGHFRMLLDVSECAIQSQDVIAAFMAHVQNVPVSRRSAVVVGGSIVRMQIRRVMNRPNVAVFGSRAEALAWIDDAAPTQATPE